MLAKQNYYNVRNQYFFKIKFTDAIIFNNANSSVKLYLNKIIKLFEKNMLVKIYIYLEISIINISLILIISITEYGR